MNGICAGARFRRNVVRAGVAFALLPATLAASTSVAGAVDWYPAGDTVSATSGTTTVEWGIWQVVCPGTAGNGIISNPVSSTLAYTAPPTFTGPCQVFRSGSPFGTVTGTAPAPWTLQAVSTTQAQLNIPAGGAVMTSSFGCTITINASSIGQANDWSNGTSTLTLTNAPGVNVTVAGSLLCVPSTVSGVMTATYTVANTSGGAAPSIS